MKLKLKDGEPICHRDCEHYGEPHWCNAKYPPEHVCYQYDPPCIWGVRQQRDELRAKLNEILTRRES